MYPWPEQRKLFNEVLEIGTSGQQCGEVLQGHVTQDTVHQLQWDALHPDLAPPGAHLPASCTLTPNTQETFSKQVMLFSISVNLPSYLYSNSFLWKVAQRLWFTATVLHNFQQYCITIYFSSDSYKMQHTSPIEEFQQLHSPPDMHSKESILYRQTWITLSCLTSDHHLPLQHFQNKIILITDSHDHNLYITHTERKNNLIQGLDSYVAHHCAPWQDVIMWQHTCKHSRYLSEWWWHIPLPPTSVNAPFPSPFKYKTEILMFCFFS